MADLIQRLTHIAVSLDQTIGCIISLGSAYPDETMSSYAYRLERRGRFFGKVFRPLIDAIFVWQPDHCYQAWLTEKARRQLPPELR